MWYDRFSELYPERAVQASNVSVSPPTASVAVDTVATYIKQFTLPVQELVFSDDGASLSCCTLKRIDSPD